MLNKLQQGLILRPKPRRRSAKSPQAHLRLPWRCARRSRIDSVLTHRLHLRFEADQQHRRLLARWRMDIHSRRWRRVRLDTGLRKSCLLIDDSHEFWARGLDASAFWDNAEELLALPPDELDPRVDKLVAESVASRSTVSVQSARRVRDTLILVSKSHSSQASTPVKLSIVSRIAPELFDDVILTKPGKSGRIDAMRRIGVFIELLRRSVVEHGAKVTLTVESGAGDADDLLCAVAVILLGTSRHK